MGLSHRHRPAAIACLALPRLPRRASPCPHRNVAAGIAADAAPSSRRHRAEPRSRHRSRAALGAWCGPGRQRKGGAEEGTGWSALGLSPAITCFRRHFGVSRPSFRRAHQLLRCTSAVRSVQPCHVTYLFDSASSRHQAGAWPFDALLPGPGSVVVPAVFRTHTASWLAARGLQRVVPQGRARSASSSSSCWVSFVGRFAVAWQRWMTSTPPPPSRAQSRRSLCLPHPWLGRSCAMRNEVRLPSHDGCILMPRNNQANRPSGSLAWSCVSSKDSFTSTKKAPSAVSCGWLLAC